MTGRQAVRAIVLHDNQLLTMKRSKFGQQYYTLVGGGVEPGEELEAALRRELREETGMAVGSTRLVFIEDNGDHFGMQYVFLCEYLGGDPALSETSEEAIESAEGQNTYQPLWLPLSELPQVSFRSESVRQALQAALANGWPVTPLELAWKGEVVGK
jgi:ADP-ribose pyrophosphatase YjhB (NUDIX family)